MEKFSYKNMEHIKYGFLSKINSDSAYSSRPARVRFLHRPVAVAAAIVVICAALTSTALALTGSWGIIDLLAGRRENIEILPDADDIVQHDLPQTVIKTSLPEVTETVGTDTTENYTQSDPVKFSVREAVYDGHNIYITVEAKPLNADHLLLAQYNDPSDSVFELGSMFSDIGGTIADYAAANNKTMIRTWAGIISRFGINQEISDIHEPDGTQVYIISGRYETDADNLELEISCGAGLWPPATGGYEMNMPKTQQDTISVTISNTGSGKTVTCTTPAVFSDYGVRVDKVTLSGSAMATYVEIEYTVTDKEKFTEGLWFEMLDENGEALPGGADSGGEIIALDDSGTRYIQKDSIRATETLMGVITLRGYDCSDKTRYETHMFEMK